MFLSGGGVYYVTSSTSTEAMVVVKVSVHPQGLSPTEAAKAWYSRHLHSMVAFFLLRGWGWVGMIFARGKLIWGKVGGALVLKSKVHESGAEDEVAPGPEEG